MSSSFSAYEMGNSRNVSLALRLIGDSPDQGSQNSQSRDSPALPSTVSLCSSPLRSADELMGRAQSARRADPAVLCCPAEADRTTGAAAHCGGRRNLRPSGKRPSRFHHCLRYPLPGGSRRRQRPAFSRAAAVHIAPTLGRSGHLSTAATIDTTALRNTISLGSTDAVPRPAFWSASQPARTVIAVCRLA
jgi:hypothetical protein